MDIIKNIIFFLKNGRYFPLELEWIFPFLKVASKYTKKFLAYITDWAVLGAASQTS